MAGRAGTSGGASGVFICSGTSWSLLLDISKDEEIVGVGLWTRLSTSSDEEMDGRGVEQSVVGCITIDLV